MRSLVLSIVVVISAMSWLVSCSSAQSTMLTEKHEAQVQREGIGMIYTDNIPCSSVIRTENGDGSSSFHCFRVGIIDSLAVAKPADKKSLEAGKYYQYDLQNDWVALINGDSTRPVFYQPRQRMENHRYEGILVFEIPKDKVADTLVYTDSYSSWGTQLIIINSNKK
jgi:hypothetical protein